MKAAHYITLLVPALTFLRSTLQYNFGWFQGGAVANYGSLVADQSDFIQNEALDKGGAIFSLGTATIRDTTLDQTDFLELWWHDL